MNLHSASGEDLHEIEHLKLRNSRINRCRRILALLDSRTFRTPVATAILALLLIAGCAKPPPAAPGPDPKAAARTYLAALKIGDYQTCYEMLADHDRDHHSLDQFLSEIPMAPNVERRWFGQIENATEYQVGMPFSHGAEMIVPVNVTTPNLVIWERMLGAPNQTRPEIRTKAERQLSSGGYPRLSYPDQMVLVEQEEQWHLVAAFDQKERIARLRDEALGAYHAFDYDQALSLYGQIMEQLEKAPFSGSGGLRRALGHEMKAIEAARASAAAARLYMSKLVIKNVVTKQTRSGASGIFGQITNSGERALDQVELTVSYGLEPGKPVYSEKHLPISTPLEFTDFDMPIVTFGPGQTRDFGILLKAPPQIQEHDKPGVTVTGIIFSEPPALPPKLAGMRMDGHDYKAGNPGAASNPPALPGASTTPKSNLRNQSAVKPM
ncbi:MAG: hypothetical protein ACLQU2_33365 [Candidatus Binataceae bacterium]